jgi:hypothetical protein
LAATVITISRKIQRIIQQDRTRASATVLKFNLDAGCQLGSLGSQKAAQRRRGEVRVKDGTKEVTRAGQGSADC